MQDSVSRTGPVKKKMPLEIVSTQLEGRNWPFAYAMDCRPLAPPQPMRTMAKEKVEITKLELKLSILDIKAHALSSHTLGNREEQHSRTG